MTGRSIASVCQRRVCPCPREVARGHPVLGGNMTYADDLDAPVEEEEFDEDDLDTDDDEDDEFDFDDEDELDEDELDEDDTDEDEPGS
jgi:hypothetical protein